MSGVTTHVLDTSIGRPAADVPVTLERHTDGEAWLPLGHGKTDADGRLRDLLPPHAAIEPGLYRLTFYTGAYFASRAVDGFYPSVQVLFEIRNAADHHHVPLLLSPYGYSTYRGS
jgi:5-hydroxyisourate hydrolase